MKNEIIWGAVCSSIGIAVGYVLTESFRLGICDANTNVVTCRELLSRIGEPIFFGCMALLVIFSILFFVPQSYKTWRKFALLSLPVMAIIFITYKDDNHGSSFMSLSSTPGQVFFDLSTLYVVISLLIISYSLYKVHKQKSK